MITYFNECCECATPAYPCLGSSCPNRRVKHVFCDICKEDVDEWYNYGGEEICPSCIIDKLEKDGVIEHESLDD